MSRFSQSIKNALFSNLDVVLRAQSKVAQSVAKENAPIGDSGNLRNSIDFSYARVGGRAVVVGSALGRDVEDYATVQHDEELRHVTTQPFKSSYKDFGSSYQAGYIARKNNSPVFAAKFLDKGINTIIGNIFNG